MAVAVAAAGAALFLLAFFAFLYSFKLIIFRHRRLSPAGNAADVRGSGSARVAADIDLEKEGEDIAVRYSWGEIESLTGGFSASSVVGEGGSSTVYLGGGATVAVKVVRGCERLHRAYRCELDALRRLRHPNIVRLLGFCDDREEGVLVFEFVPNGTLHEKLHGGTLLEKLHGGGRGSGTLPWARRLSIASQIAGAAAYLHDGCDPPVVHGDIKSSNVLLDHRLHAKLCDFGSARAGFSAAIINSSGHGGVAGKSPVMGSPGYVDPHYVRTGILSKKSDVYSFGVLLLELITGAEAFCADTERPLVFRVAPHLAAPMEMMVDPSLGGGYDAGEAAAAVALAAACVGAQPGLRPAMAEVARALSELPSVVAGVDGKWDGDKAPEQSSVGCTVAVVAAEVKV